MNYTNEVKEYINSASENQIPTLEELRKLIDDNVENASEAIKWNMPVFMQTKNFAYMRHAKDHITFGFSYNIDKLKDPGHLLKGDGKTMKHIKINTLDNKLKKQIIKWLEQVTE